MFDFWIQLDEILIAEQNFTLHNVVDLTSHSSHRALEEETTMQSEFDVPVRGKANHYLH